MQEHITKHKAVIGSVLVVFLFVFVVFYIIEDTSTEEEDNSVALARSADVVQEVSVTGRVKSVRTVDLAFERAGKIAWTYVSIGDEVRSGELLAELVNTDVIALRNEAQAKVEEAESDLSALIKGTRSEELLVAIQEVKQARVALLGAKKQLLDALRDADTKADDAIFNKIDQLFDNIQSSSPDIIFTTTYEVELESSRIRMKGILEELHEAVIDSSDEALLEASIETVQEKLKEISAFIDLVAIAINSLKSSASISTATISSYRTDVSTARTNVNTVRASITDAIDTHAVAKESLALEEGQLALLEAGATSEAIRSQEAKVRAAEARVLQYDAELEKTYVRAPFRGVITKISIESGESVSAYVSILSIIAPSSYEIEAFVPEADIAKVHEGDLASITLDAYGGNTLFNAKVTKIDPAETILEGVSTYKVALVFDEEDSRIKPGMTANIDIATGFKEEVVVVPTRSVITRESNTFVRIKNESGEIIEIPVKTGLYGSFGEVEIVSGVSIGDRIVVFIPE